jgi:hypothetical protein
VVADISNLITSTAAGGANENRQTQLMPAGKFEHEGNVLAPKPGQETCGFRALGFARVPAEVVYQTQRYCGVAPRKSISFFALQNCDVRADHGMMHDQSIRDARLFNRRCGTRAR